MVGIACLVRLLSLFHWSAHARKNAYGQGETYRKGKSAIVIKHAYTSTHLHRAVTQVWLFVPSRILNYHTSIHLPLRLLLFKHSTLFFLFAPSFPFTRSLPCRSLLPLPSLFFPFLFASLLVNTPPFLYFCSASLLPCYPSFPSIHSSFPLSPPTTSFVLSPTFRYIAPSGHSFEYKIREVTLFPTRYEIDWMHIHSRVFSS